MPSGIEYLSREMLKSPAIEFFRWQRGGRLNSHLNPVALRNAGMGRFLRWLGLSLSVLLLATVLPKTTALACTTAVISGKATRDGRPLLWKNRDAPNFRNELVFIEDGRYKVLAVVNAGARQSIWMGVNSAGLCIENSVTNDLAFPKTAKGLGNGSFMLKVLRDCATVADVEKLLEETNQSGRSTAANFGVIDAEGGAVLFETARASYRKFDANDPLVAPHGFVVRSNFSITGKNAALKSEGATGPTLNDHPSRADLADVYSAERYFRARELLQEPFKSHDDQKNGPLDVRYLLRHVARDLADAAGTPCAGSVNSPEEELPPFIETKNTISRTTTVSFVVFHGVKPGENPLLTTMWAGLGDPKFTIAVPCWVGMRQVSVDLRGEKEGGPVGVAARQLRQVYYRQQTTANDTPVAASTATSSTAVTSAVSGSQTASDAKPAERGEESEREEGASSSSGAVSSGISGIETTGLKPIWESVWNQEDEVIERVERLLAQWRAKGVSPISQQMIHVQAAEQGLTALQEAVRQAEKLFPAGESLPVVPATPLNPPVPATSATSE